MMQQNKTILVIDDDTRNVFAMSAVLRSRGYTCLGALSMAEAFAYLNAKENIDLVLIDMMMPGMDGYEAIPLIRESLQQAKMPLIAVTAQAMPGDRQKCLEAGADDYLAKPVNTDKLFKMLDNYLQNKAS